MSLLLLPKEYADGQVLHKTALDAIVNALLAFFNTQKLGGDNVQTGGIAQSNLSLSAQTLPIGSITEYPLYAFPNTQWVGCYGQALSTSAYPALFAICGYTYGGSGSSFNVPDMRGRVVAGLAATSSQLTIVASNMLGASGGNELLSDHTHGTSVVASNTTGSTHTHTLTDTTHGHGIQEFVEDIGSPIGSGDSLAHGTVPPVIVPAPIPTTGSGFSNVTGTIIAAEANFGQTAITPHNHTITNAPSDATGLGTTGAVQPTVVSDFYIRVL